MLNVQFADANTQRVIVRGLKDLAALGSCEATEGRRALTDLVKGQDVVLAIGGGVDRDATGTLVRDVSLNGVDVAASVLAEVAVACPAGEVEDIYIGECMPEMAPNTPGGAYPTTDSAPGAITSSTPGDPSSLPEVQGIPCTGANTGQCIGLQENAVPNVEPRSSISSSP